ncbi:MAG: AAA family ATPase [Candidatus Aminicenantes bacterium]|nr:AAA family ATPase [Candidatus Aminicenantes bacterium]NIN21887.1 AAA family ATPase [Candidatus Aminicenantes bacterium]NIN45665.1 AAA family ATPase [Candidatus Aminicenantes bacterium]NIN88498.1 AAA family ATPase [Candidatus Aminicenantes bacterium]NIO84929.1 AAA family ATPase [Candidatus Aminicenantes bacterium]
MKRKKTNAENILSQRYEKFQKTSLLWFPLITVLIYLFAHLNEKIKINTSLHIVAVGFVFIPLIIVHVPDYLIYLPLWIRKQQKIMESKNTRESILNFENSILFKHELLFFQLPGLNKILTSYVENKKIGITETVKHIVNLYLFTSQKKQALKAVVDLSKKKAYLHHLFLSLLEFNGDDLIKHLATSNRVAKLYLMLLETIDFKKIDKIDGSNLAWLLRRDIFRVSKNEKREFIPETLESRIYFVYLEMTKEEGYRFNEEMIKTLEADHILLTAEGLKDICRASGKLEEINEFPTEINYFSFIKIISSELKKIKDTLLKINAIERIESRRSTLSDQKQKFEDLINNVVPKLFEPFRHVWNSGLNHCIEVIEKEIQILQGSAVLTIELKNNEILASEKEQNLYFEIFNKGQELATNISITLKTDNHEHFFPGNTMENIDVIESDTVREISFPITAPSTCKTTVRGILTFSDRAKEDKTVEFSFPVTILEKSVEFEEIKNPYIVGQPLKGGSTLFFGREDVYKFIDKNILASGDHHTIVCHGLRRTGKTSLIYQLEAQGFTDKRLVPLNIDMQAVDDEKDFYSTLSSTIVEKLSLHSASPIENFSQFKMFLKEIKPELGKRIIVLMIDEFEELQLRVEEKKFSQTVFSNLRHLMQHEEKLVFLFFGSHKLEEMSADYWSIFFNTAIYLRISHLKREDAIRLIKEPVKGQLTYDDLTVNQILKMTGCQPYLIQLICRMLVNDLNEYKKRNYAVIDDVDNVVEGIIDEGKEHLSQHIWDESNRLEHFILSSAAEELTHKKLDHTGIDTIFDKIKPILPNFYRKQSMQALDKLVSKEVLAEKNMNYWFPINLLRKWIAARYPLRKVKEEI